MPRRAAVALGGAAISVALLFVVWFAAFHIGFFERADQRVFSGFAGLRQHRNVHGVASFIANLCDPKPYIYFCILPPLVALARRRLPVALAVSAILLGANVTTELLKPLLAQPRAASLFHGHHPVAPASWPSGHATAAMSLALCFVLAVPARWRPATAALGAAFAVAVSYSFLTLGWHYPSDVFGGFLVAAAWTLLGIGALSAADERWPRRRREPVVRGSAVPVREALRAPAAALLAFIGAIALLAFLRPHSFISYAQAHEAFVVGAAGIAALSLVIATGVMLVVRR
jgi:membrane-associated phospholipid phosphatase